MIILGLLLLVIAGAFGIDLIVKNDVHIANPTVFGERLGIHSAASLFVVGAITGAAVLLGVAVLIWGIRRKGVHVVSRRHERAETRRVREERDQLRAQTAPAPTSTSDQAPAPTGNADTEAGPATTPTPVDDTPHPADRAQPQEA
jgi:steroid 5-alpha reductase family enzyme